MFPLIHLFVDEKRREMATFHCRFLEEIHKCLEGAVLVLGHGKEVHKGP